MRWSLNALWLAIVLASCSPTTDQDGDVDGNVDGGSESCDALGLADRDSDTISDEMEGERDTDGDGLADRSDTDSDDDGRLDIDEAGFARDCADPAYDADEDGTPDYIDLDSDDNGILDRDETDDDIDSDGVPNWRDRDDDGDRIQDIVELGSDPYDAPDSDGDGIADYHDTDSDDDELLDGSEGTDDIDGDGLGNWRDIDSDGDGLLDSVEGTGDCDGDGLGNYVDIDSNGDGIPDWEPGEVIVGVCPLCEPDCYPSGPVVPTPTDEGAEGVEQNPDGPGIVIGSESTDAGYAWVANSEDPWPGSSGLERGTVTKLDLETGEEVGRFVVGLPGQSNSPSRTAVDGNGDAYIACRCFGCQGTVVKIAADEADCFDANHNGRIDTSVDSEPLPYGEDECVLWTTEVGGIDGVPRAITVDLGGPDSPQGMPWVGLFNRMQLIQLDPDDGTEIATVALGQTPYGAALDSMGGIWLSSLGTTIQRVDSYAYEADPPIPLGGGCSSTYGIATDPSDRVWVAASQACRYDPADESWFVVNIGAYGRGVAVDPFGVVWVAGNGPDNFIGFNSDDGSDLRSIPTGGGTPVGIAVDSRGFVWAINQSTNNASRLDPATETVDTFPVGQGPYTYSDFTGFQRARVFSQGIWSTTFEACPERDADTTLGWQSLTWTAQTPGSTSIEFRAQSANTPEGLSSAPTVSLATIPGSVSPIDIQDAFDAVGEVLGWYLKLTVVLRSAGGSTSPVLEDVEVSWMCGYDVPE